MRQEIGTMDLNHDFSEQVIGMGHKIIIPDLSNDGLYGIPSFRKAGYKWLIAVPLMTYRAHGILGTASRNRKLLKKDTADLIMTIAGLIAAALSKSHLAHGMSLQERPDPAPTNLLTENRKNGEKKPAAEPAPEMMADKKPTSEPTPEIIIDPKPSVKSAPEAVKDEKPAAERAPEAETDKKPAEETLVIKTRPRTEENTTAPEKKPDTTAKLKVDSTPSRTPPKRPDGAFHSHARKMEQFRKTHG
jgi:outer membrane biosynthesis protein TonB